MNKLREKRREKGYSQEEIAKRLNISQSNYSKYEAGTLEMSITNAIKLAELYNIDVLELFSNKKKTSSTTSPTKQRALDIFNQLADNDYLVLIGYMEHLLLEKEQKQKQRINTLIDNINRGE